VYRKENGTILLDPQVYVPGSEAGSTGNPERSPPFGEEFRRADRGDSSRLVRCVVRRRSKEPRVTGWPSSAIETLRRLSGGPHPEPSKQVRKTLLTWRTDPPASLTATHKLRSLDGPVAKKSLSRRPQPNSAALRNSLYWPMFDGKRESRVLDDLGEHPHP